MKVLDILNTNVYLTNIISIPVIILIYYIVQDINTWKSKDNDNDNNLHYTHLYEYLWKFYLLLSVIAFILSNMYHLNMFSNNTFLKKIAILDSIFSAPLTFIIMILLIILYYIYLHNTSGKETQEQEQLKKASVPIYRIGIFFIMVGCIVFLLKAKIYQHNYYDALDTLKTVKDQAIWTSGHIFFHYMCYTGGLLIVLLYYIENKQIYQTLKKFKNDK